MSLGPAAAAALLRTFTHFLTVAVHNILFYRGLYPAATFLTARAYGLAVHQSRHPRLCGWVRDAVDAVRAQLVAGAVERIAVVVYGPPPRARVLERWLFDVAAFPAFRGLAKDGADDDDPPARVNWANVDEQLRAALRRLAHAGEKLAPLPPGCTFTVAVELRDQDESPNSVCCFFSAPVVSPGQLTASQQPSRQPWMPTEPNLQTASSDRPAAGEDVGGARTMPLRSVEAGPLFFECWVEEGKAKGEQAASQGSTE